MRKRLLGLLAVLMLAAGLSLAQAGPANAGSASGQYQIAGGGTTGCAMTINNIPQNLYGYPIVEYWWTSNSPYGLCNYFEIIYWNGGSFTHLGSAYVSGSGYSYKVGVWGERSNYSCTSNVWVQNYGRVYLWGQYGQELCAA